MTTEAQYDRSILGLCQRSHEISKEKGWLDEPRTFAMDAALMHSELSEALEDYRNHRGLTEIYWQKGGVEVGLKADVEYTAGEYKPCGVPIELADFAIRVCQYSGSNGLGDRLDSALAGLRSAGAELRPQEFDQVIASMHADISLAYLTSIGAMAVHPFPVYLASTLFTVFEYAKSAGIDLWGAIQMKEAYNRTRPYRHGGKKA